MAAETDAKAGGKSNFARNFKIVSLALVAIVVLIIVLQNRDPVETHIFFLHFTMSRAVLLFACLVIGFVLGILASFRRR